MEGMEEGHLGKQVFRESAVLASCIPLNSTHKSWEGQVVSFLALLWLPHDLNALWIVKTKAVLQLPCIAECKPVFLDAAALAKKVGCTHGEIHSSWLCAGCW